MSMRTPFSRVTGLGSAKEGTGHFITQRVTGFANLFLAIFLIWFLATIAGADRVDVVALVGNPVVAALLVLSIFSIAWHMRIGMQVVIEDYVHGEVARIAALAANTFFTFGAAGLCLVSVLKLAFGG